MKNLQFAAMVCGVVWLAASPRIAAAQTRSVDDYLAKVNAIGEPPFDAARKAEPGYLDTYRSAQHALYQQKAAILLEACRTHGSDPRVPELMDRRWKILGWNQKPADVAEEVLADIDRVLADETNPAVIQHGKFWQALYVVVLPGPADTKVAGVEAFLQAYPNDARGKTLLAQLASDATVDRAARLDAYRKLADAYPKAYITPFVPGLMRQLEQIGQPFALEFDDAITGRHVSMADLRGKVVVIDFWATTCGPCVREMPQMKALFAKYHERGVEFIGVSLDVPESRGGLRAVRNFVKQNSIPWPQYYQGNGYDSAFSKGWGVGSIPTVFVVDKVGRLQSTEARGQLESLIPELLAEAGD